MKFTLTIKDRVKKLLEQYPHLRDNDEKLIANIWYAESQHLVGKMQFLEYFAKGKLSNPESIRRSRQQLQEMYPLLRGKADKNRQDRADEVRYELIESKLNP